MSKRTDRITNFLVHFWAITSLLIIAATMAWAASQVAGFLRVIVWATVAVALVPAVCIALMYADDLKTGR